MQEAMISITSRYRKNIYDLIHKIAPEYECPEGLVCHVSTPNRNCFYWKGVEKTVEPYDNEIEFYEDSYGFCPVLLDFILLVFNNLRRGRSYNENHDCDLWDVEYYEANVRENINRTYHKCVICGKESDIIELELQQIKQNRWQ